MLFFVNLHITKKITLTMQKILNLIFFIFLISIHPTYAQIAIGVNEKPEPGALLQLKNKEGIFDDSANSLKV